MFFNKEHLKASNQKLHNDHSLERIHQKNAFTATGFIFTVTSVLCCLPVSSILLPMTITKAIRNLTYQIVLFYNNLVATCKIQDKTVQFLMWNIWRALEAARKRYALKYVMWWNHNRLSGGTHPSASQSVTFKGATCKIYKYILPLNCPLWSSFLAPNWILSWKKKNFFKVEPSQEEWSIKTIVTESLFLEQNENKDLN